MNRFLLPCVVLFAMLAAAPAANAQLTTLYNTIEGPQTVQGINSVAVGPSFLGEFRAATSFVPTRSGNASVLSMRGQCVIPYPQGTTCQGIGEVSIQRDVNGRPSGESLGTMGFYLTDSLSSGNPVKKECGRLSPAVPLTAGTKYWAVMTAPDGIGWNNWTDDASEVLESIDGGEWKRSPNQKRLALRIDAGVDECVPDAKILPPAGETLGDLYVRTGGVAVNSLTVENTGLAPLTWSGYTVTGADAQYFSVVPQPGQPFRFPRQIGVGGLTLGNVQCTGGPQERWYRATVTLQTNDPDTPNHSFPVECLVDNTGPAVDYERPAPDGRNGWFVNPIRVNAWAIDPEPSSLVRALTCVRGDQRWDSPGAALTATLETEGAHGLGCWASDRVGNGGSSSWHEFKLDTREPVIEPIYSPDRTADGWNNTATSVRFECEDPVPGSGLDSGVTGGGSVSTETAGTNFTSSSCDDIAGNVSTPVTATIRIDMTRPVVRVASVSPAPNAAGWNRSNVTVAFDCADTGIVQSGIKTDTVADIVVSEETDGRDVESAGTCADKAANQAQSVEQHVKLDKTAPTTTIDSGPPAITRATDAEITFSGDDGRSGLDRLECSLDGGAYADCDGSTRFTGLGDGRHTVSIRAVDVAGNVDASPATHVWTVDTVAPDTAINSGPAALTRSRSAAFTYRGEPLGGTAIAGFECRLDDAAWGACADPQGLGDGEHRFQVRAVDAAGNADDSPAAHTWTVDTVAPATTITRKPDARTTRTHADFTVAADEATGFECRVDGAPYARCDRDVRFEGLAAGSHTFDVRASDAAGNVEDPPVSYSWVVATLVAVDDDATTEEDTPVMIDVTANDVRPGPVTLVADAASAEGGTVTVEGTALRYSPPAGFTGSDSFGYEATHGAETASATVTVTVTAAEDEPPAPDPDDDDVPAPPDTGQPATGQPAQPATGEPGTTVTGAGANAAPTVTVARGGRCGRSSSGTFRVHIEDDGAGRVEVTGTVSNARVGLQIRGSGATRMVSITRPAGLRRATVTLRVVDGPHEVDIPMGLAVGTARADRLRGTEGPDLLFGRGGRDRIAGLGGDDLLCGGTGSDRLDGGAGNDVLIAGRGDDRLMGGDGNDELRGDTGADRMIGGAGDDVLRGGPRADVFDAAPGADRLVDFSARRGDVRS